MEMEGKKVMDLKNFHKSKKAPVNLLRLSADHETAIHTSIISTYFEFNFNLKGKTSILKIRVY
jgi:hypothetical protein